MNKSERLEIRKKAILEIINSEDGYSASEKGKAINSFEKFRKKYPGKKKGMIVELSNFIKKHEGWVIESSKLMVGLEKEVEQKILKDLYEGWAPSWKNMQTWINNACWDQKLRMPVKPKDFGGDDNEPEGSRE